MNKFKAKASKANQAQSRLKALEKMQSRPQLIKTPVANFSIPSAENLAPPIINLSEVNIGYDETIILKKLNLRIDPEDRIALLGSNGQGKSTFLKLIAGKLSPKKGELFKSNKLRVGYFSQDLVDNFIPHETAFQHVASQLPNSPRGEIISKLSLAGISNTQISIPVRKLSGGQKTRLAILLATLITPHLLILDEPTNHLDIESREKLATALNQFAGAILLVSHDPHLIALVATELWLVKNGSVSRFDSDLSAYQKLLLTQDIKGDTQKKCKKTKITHSLNDKKSIDHKALKKQVAKAENRVQQLQIMRQSLHPQFNDPNIYSPINAERLKKLKQKHLELNQALELAENIWLEAVETMEIDTTS